MKDGEHGIIWGLRGIKTGHVFNVIKKDGRVIFIDGQIGTFANTRDRYTDFKFFKIK